MKDKIVHALSRQWVRRGLHMAGVLVLLLLALPVPLAADDLFGSATHYWSDSGVPRISVAAHDVTGDGQPDVVAGHPYPSLGFALASGSADGTLTPAVYFNGGSTSRSFGFGYFNDDALIDLAVAYTDSHYVEVRLNNGAAWYFDDIPTYYSTGMSPVSVVAGDLNSDGFDDLVVANRDSESVSVLLNDQDGTFTVTAYPLVEPYNPNVLVPVDVALGDFDGDDDLDIGVLLQARSAVWPIWNDGAGVFALDVTLYGTGVDPVALTVADFDGDGYDDIAVANQSDAEAIRVWCGYADESNHGFSVPHDSYAVSDLVTDIAAGDFDGDGNTDLAVSDGDDDCVWVLLGDGAGDFGTAEAYSVGEQPVALESVDLDSSGRCDLVTANYASENVSVLLSSSGPSTVALPLTLEAGWNLISVPLTIGENTVDEVFAAVDYGAIYLWAPDSTPGTYSALEGTDTIEPDCAYWLSLETDPTEPVVLQGAPVEAADWSADLSAGWNMVGTPYSAGTFAFNRLNDGGSSALQDDAIYWWDTGNKRYELMESGYEFVPGAGYWMAATTSCTLTFVEPE